MSRIGSVGPATRVGSLVLRSPVLTASGTAGHGAELADYFDLASLGAVVVKSLSHHEWAGNPAPRVHPTAAGMLNSVGLQGPGLAAWARHDLPALVDAGAAVVVSIWGRSVADYAAAAEIVAGFGPEVIAVEVNVSCPNLEARGAMFSAHPDTTAAAVAATEVAGRPRWAKLSPQVADLVPIVAAAHDAGAEAVTLANTLLGMVIDIETRRPVLGGGGGGLSGPAIHPVAVRAVYDVHAALPQVPIIGVGGVSTGVDAIELMLAGASAVGVGTATFADPAAAATILGELGQWCHDHGIDDLAELVGAAHRTDPNDADRSKQ